MHEVMLIFIREGEERAYTTLLWKSAGLALNLELLKLLKKL